MANRKYIHRIDPVTLPVTNWQEVPVIFDIPMAARLLGKTVEVVRRMIVNGQLPAQKTGGEWRLRKDTVMQMMGYLPWEIERYGFGMNTPREETILATSARA